ncbi:MAG: hypothetical protein A2928_02195 [Candidatus Taylorbacteria bacterium RIFCSPLOWO2_01_FULL_45_15b]|uniref:PLD phosphodiesterase domain-containing protein n=1 Tax=Candidatus Taylorbacteria bacterium RIFCSPLOWO2_01_FULL_45_15b TaxID=1802319 RepID=A0A1G2N710_9BACT|nr:MAG: hypothetical protein A2928_02195 [Candidatus Taylorbacteria bacterium RIFCSPLOWO2_01_FULL_45_15b]
MQAKPWKFFLYAPEAWNALLESVRGAKNSIDFEQFIFADTPIGREFAEVFKKKSSEGVAVRLLCDTAGSYGFFNSQLHRELVGAGVNVVFFNHISPWRVHHMSLWIHRDHRKLAIIDGKEVFLGGVGINDNQRLWRDTHLSVTEISFIEQAVALFEAMWRTARDSRFAPFRGGLETRDGFNLVANAPKHGYRHIYYRYVNALRKARGYAYMTTPYFVPPRKFVRAACRAARRGVDVRILLPERSDNFYVDKAGEHLFHILFRSGVRVFRYRSSMLHAKTFVIDGAWASVGSANLDNICLRYNYEITALSSNREFAEAVKGHFLDDLTRSREVDPHEWARRPWIVKVIEFGASLFSEVF